MDFWVARNTDDTLVLFQSKPILNDDLDWEEVLNEDYMFIPDNLYTEVTWENSPQRIKLELIKE